MKINPTDRVHLFDLDGNRLATFQGDDAAAITIQVLFKDYPAATGASVYNRHKVLRFITRRVD